ncbi:unnamed protein product [Symbiodinium sp. CCMP2592]|nr:unnamed protein product [Symbiodinium sp. CCMP2592]
MAARSPEYQACWRAEGVLSLQNRSHEQLAGTTGQMWMPLSRGSNERIARVFEAARANRRLPVGRFTLTGLGLHNYIHWEIYGMLYPSLLCLFAPEYENMTLVIRPVALLAVFVLLERNHTPRQIHTVLTCRALQSSHVKLAMAPDGTLVMALEDLSAEVPLLKAILPVAFDPQALPQAVESVLSDSGEQVTEPCVLQAVIGHNHARIETRSVGVESKWFYHMHDSGFSRFQDFLPHTLQQQSTSLCLKLPAPHALLLASGRWTEYCLPVVRSGRSRSFSAGAALLQALPLPPRAAAGQPEQDAADVAHVDLSYLSQLARSARRLLNTERPMSALEVAQARQDVQSLLAWRESLLVEEARMSHRVYSMQTLVEAVLVSSRLRSTADLGDVLRHGIRLVFREEGVCRYFLSLLERKYAVPKKSYLTKHRLTVILAYARALAEEVDELLDRNRTATGESIVRWSTMDSSPQKGFEWVMQGHRYMAVSELPSAVDKADLLISGSLEPSTEQNCRQFLAARLLLRPCLPAAIGSARASVGHKIRASAHAERAACNSWQQCAHLMNSTFTRTGDLGAEAHVIGWSGRLTDLCGNWIKKEEHESEPQFEPEAFEFIGAAEGSSSGGELKADCNEEAFQFHSDMATARADLPAAVVGPSLHLDFSPQIYIAGLLHIAHNVSKDLHQALEHWPVFTEQLTQVCKLLSSRISRQRLLETCFSEPPWSAFQARFESFNAQVYGGRWNTAMEAVQDLLPLIHILRRAWSGVKFGVKGQDRDTEEPDGDRSRVLSLSVVDEALKSSMFPAYLHAMHSVAECLSHISHWAESCPCTSHSSDRAAQTCPLRSSRAPELAAGALPLLVKRSFDVAHGHLLALEETSRLTPAELKTLVADWTAARRHVLLLVDLKLSHWQQLPYIAFGMGHHCPDVRRKAAVQTLRLYDAAKQNPDQPRTHPLCELLCAADSACRREIERLASGETAWNQLPTLKVWAGKFKFAPVAERWVEGLHAATKRSVRAAPHAGPAHIAFEFMSPHLRTWLRESPERLAMLAKHCRCTSNPLKMSDAAGLRHHPGIESLLVLSYSGKKKILPPKASKQVVPILFHCDPASHFRPLPESLLSTDRASLPTMGPACILPQAAVPEQWQHLWCKYALQHFKACVADSAMELTGSSGKASRVYSFHNATSPIPLSSYTSPACPPVVTVVQDISREFEFVSESASTALGAAAQGARSGHLSPGLPQEWFFFRVAHSNPGRVVYVPGTAPLQGDGQMIVEQLPLLRLSPAKTEASVAVEGQDTLLFVLSAVASTPEDLLGIHHWQTDEALQTNLEPAFLACVSQSDREELQTLLQRVVAQDAFAFKGAGRSINLEHDVAGFDSTENRPLVVARHMAALGVFTCISAGEESSEWQMTRAGLESVSLSFSLRDPKPLIVAPAVDTLTTKSASEMATVQILIFLKNQGWEFSVRRKGDKPRCPEPYRFGTDDSPKVCWVHYSQKALCHEYLAALATAAEHLKEVPHFETKAFYASLLFGGDESKQSSTNASKRKRAGRKAEGFEFQNMYNPSMPDQVPSAQPVARKRKAPAARGSRQRGRGRNSQPRGSEAADPPAEVQDTQEADDDSVVNFEDVSISPDFFGDVEAGESADSGDGSVGSNSGSTSSSSSSSSSPAPEQWSTSSQVLQNNPGRAVDRGGARPVVQGVEELKTGEALTKTQMADDTPKVSLLPRAGMSLPKPVPKSKPKGSVGHMLERRQHEQQQILEESVKAKNRPGKKERERKRRQMSSDGSEGSWTPVSFAPSGPLPNAGPANKRPRSSSGPQPWDFSQIGSMLPKTVKTTPAFKVKREFTYDPQSGNVCHFSESIDTR